MRRFLGIACWAALVAVLGGCEESVNPILDSERNYTLFGTLDMQADTQYVRVERIREVLDPGSPQPLGVRFTSTDLATGDVVTWRDSLVSFADGSSGHVFYAPLRLITGHAYRVQVDDSSESVATWAETTVPAFADAQIGPENVQGGAGGAIGSGQQRITFQNVPSRPFRVEAWYRFMVAERTPFADVVLPYEPTNGPTASGDWEVTLDLRKDRLTLDTLIQVREYPLMGVGVRVTVLDEAFVPPGGVFDPEILVQPGTMSNVHNGFGFVGSVARFSTEWLLSEDAMDRLDYVSLADIFGRRAEDVRREVIRASHAHAGSGDHPRVQ